jgi:hypothetical protein
VRSSVYLDDVCANFCTGYLSQPEGLSPEKFFDEAGEQVNPDNERMRAMLLDWSQRVETWQKTKLIADRAMGSFVADKVRIFQPRGCRVLILGHIASDS